MGDIRIPGYEITELIGRGGMASVWKAKQLSLDRTVAIKILASSFADQPSDIQRFHEEARVAAKLRHSGIVQVIDAGATDGLYYFVMEFIDGYTVGDWLRRKAVLSEGDALDVADCVADALQYAWEQSGMVHCDIKPDNILVDSDGTVKVADLGLSRTLNAMQRLDEAEEILGTPAYMSPEQARGEAGMDCRADIYSLGAMLYELVTGQRLFHGLSDDEVMVQQLQGQAPGPHEITRQLSARMSELIELLLAKDKEQRPADWGQVRQLIKRVKRCYPLPLRLAEKAACTVRRRPAPRQNWKTDVAHRNMRQWKQSDNSRHLQLLIGLVIVVFLALIIYGVRRNRLSAPIRVDPPQLRPTSSPPSMPDPAPSRPATPVRPITLQPAPVPVSVSNKQPVRPASLREDPELAREWQAVQEWIAKQPGRSGEGAWRIKKLLPSLEGTVYEAPARAEMNRLNVLQARMEAEEAEEAEKARQKEALRRKQKAELRQKLEDARTLSELLKKPNSHPKPFLPLPTDPDLRAAEIGRRHRRKLAKEEQQRLLTGKVELARAESLTPPRIVKSLLADQMDEAERLVAWWDRKVKGENYAHLVSDLHRDIQALNKIDEDILKSFSDQSGMLVRVRLTWGAENLIVQGVSDGVVRATRDGSGSGDLVEFGVDDLVILEKLTRMGSHEDSYVMLAKGLMAYECGAYEHARRYFEEANPLILKELLKFVDAVDQ